MTAEIAIINRQAIALAADSAVTIGRERVWKYSNKLFSLGPSNDIAVMVYGSGEFAGFPWETIIKTYRSEAALQKYSTVEECAISLVNFLADSRFMPDKLNRQIHLSVFLDEIAKLKKSMPKYSKKVDFRKALQKRIADRSVEISHYPVIKTYADYKTFCRIHDRSLVKELSMEVLGEKINNNIAEDIMKMLFEFSSHQLKSEYSTGLVVAGYGRDEFFPVIYEYIIDGKDECGVRSWISHIHDQNIDDIRKTIVVPFAQGDIFHLFMEGISPEYIPFLNNVLLHVLNSKSDDLISKYVHDDDERKVETAIQHKENKNIVDKFSMEFKKYRHDSVVQPILSVVRALPKEEMADMALALVELTSLRRKVDSPVESVGGPVDVAVISKGDGLIWVKRKHYFDIDKNGDFVQRKMAQRSESNGKGS